MKNLEFTYDQQVSAYTRTLERLEQIAQQVLAEELVTRSHVTLLPTSAKEQSLKVSPEPTLLVEDLCRLDTA